MEWHSDDDGDGTGIFNSCINFPFNVKLPNAIRRRRRLIWILYAFGTISVSLYSSLR